MNPYLKRMLTYSKRYWKQLLFSGITSTLFGIFAAAPSYVIQHVIDVVIVQKHTHLLLPFVFLFIGLFVCKAIFMYLSGYYMDWVGNKVVNDLRRDLLQKIIYFPLSFYKKKTTGELLAHFLSDIALVQHASSRSVRLGIRSFFEAIALLIVAFMQNWKLTMLMLLIGPVIAVTIKRMGTFMRSTTRFTQAELGKVSSILQEMFIGIREIKSCNTEAEEVNRFTSYLNNYFSSIIKNVHIVALAPAAIEILAMGSIGIVFYAAVLQVINGTITPGQLGSFFAAILLAYQPIKRLINVYAEVQSGIAASGRIFDVMDSEYPDPTLRTDNYNRFSHAITFSNVAFRYDDHNTVLDNISFSIHKGESVGIMGPSGSGKSTLCDLLLGFISPTSGTISLDGHNIATLAESTIRHQFGYVSQHPFLFNDTIYANVAYGKTNATEDEIIEACRGAHAHDFISRLPKGYQTLVGENGTLLSGGQKQRLTIARALLRKPPILLFDEATSALDRNSENMIHQALEEISTQKTVIVISHRLSFLDKMDRIFSINDTHLQEITKNTLPTEHSRQL